ncbi:ankyrin repeat domain-containing protein, partial [Wolbachia endosymbiont of Pentidionis agamae]|uniref:ankyrin repeat domain-containing protein n=1 Tax=Wolbachia endosymbiont of Pentidionis agamae TaxID=3110435 RepID=UPI002FCF2E8D
ILKNDEKHKENNISEDKQLQKETPLGDLLSKNEELVKEEKEKKEIISSSLPSNDKDIPASNDLIDLQSQKKNDADKIEDFDKASEIKNILKQNDTKAENSRNENNTKQKEPNKKWRASKKKSIPKWKHKEKQSKYIHKRHYDDMNQHLPTEIYITDYVKQLFYCISEDNILCIESIMDKLEEMDFTTKEVLELKNKLGDTPLIYAVKKGKIDTVRFLLMHGAEPDVLNNELKSPLDIAIEIKRNDIINAINEMSHYVPEYKKIPN